MSEEWKPSRQSAAPGDIRYLLRDIEYTPLLFSPGPRADRKSDEPGTQVVGFLRRRGHATVQEMREHIPPLGELSYQGARALVVRLVDAGVLAVDGQVPLEEVDTRYERVPACDLCGSPSEGHKVLFWKYYTPVVRCSDCELMYANPRWKAEHLFGRYTPEYWQLYADAVQHTAVDPVANQARWDPYLDSLELARQTGRLLDVGCATGEFLLAAKNRGWETYGVETSPSAAARAQEITGSPIHTGTLDTAPYSDGWFDVITLWDVIEHMQSPRASVTHVARLLRPGGMLAILTPNIRSLVYWLRGRHWWVVGPNDHIYYFAPRTLARLLMECGFSIHHVHTLDMTLGAWLEKPKLKEFAPLLRAATRPITTRFLLGDVLFVLARRDTSITRH